MHTYVVCDQCGFRANVDREVQDDPAFEVAEVLEHCGDAMRIVKTEKVLA